MLTIATQATVPTAPSKHDAFVQTLDKSPLKFAFASDKDFLQFLDDHAKDHVEAKRKFEELPYQKLFSRIQDVEVTEHFGDVNWKLALKVRTIDGDFDIDLFTSIKRHALLSFLSNHHTPRNPKQINSIVRDADRLKKCLQMYGERVRNDLKARGYAFRFDARDYNKELLDGAMVLGCDSKPISENPALKQELHVFPSSGPEVRRIDDHKKYDALVTFLLWFFRTEQCSGAAAPYNRVEKIRREQGAQSYGEYVKGLQKNADYARLQYAELKAAGVPFQKNKVFTAADVDKLEGKANGWAVNAARTTHGLLAAHGVVARVATAKRDAIANPAKPNLNKAPKDEHTAGQLTFKTHKAEVKSKLGDMPWDIVAWVLDGRLQKDLGEIRVVLENYKIDKATTKSLVSGGVEDADVAHAKPLKDRIETEEARFAVNGATTLHDKLNQAMKWYWLAVESNDPLLKSVQPA